MGEHLCLLRFLCLVSGLSSLLKRSDVFLHPVPAPRGTHNCVTDSGTVRGYKLVSRLGDQQSGLFTWSRQRHPTYPLPSEKRNGSQIGPRRTEPCCRQTQGAPYAANMPAPGGNCFCSDVCLPAFVPLCAGSGAGFRPGYAAVGARTTYTRKCSSSPTAASAAPSS